MLRLAILISALAVGACSSAGNGQETSSRPSGGGTSRSYDAAGFERVAVEGASEVVVRTGTAASVRAEGDAEVLDHLDISVRGNTLVIGHKRNRGFDFSGPRGTAKVFVTLPTLDGAAIGGSGSIEVDKVAGDAFEGSISGSGDLKIGSLQVRTAEFAIAGSGNVEAAGTAEKLDLNIAGSGDLKLEGVESRTLNVSIAGSGNTSASATETANVSILGSGDVAVSGPAKCTVSKMGSGTARCNA